METWGFERYPPAPWRLQGTSVQALRLIDSSAARRLVPHDLRVVSVWPRKTLAVLYCASYEPPSVLRYRELVFAPALVAAGGRIGFWISHIYVDDPISLAGGRSIWGLPKALATFEWQPERREVAVRSEGQALCRIRWGSGQLSGPGGLSVPIPLHLPVISRGAAGFQFFSGRGSLSVARLSGGIVIEPGSPLAGLQLEESHTLIAGRSLRLRVDAPQRVITNE